MHVLVNTTANSTTILFCYNSLYLQYNCYTCRLMLGIMLPTWFLSMWMSNTATTAMMIPILNAILAQIKEVRNKGKLNNQLL